MNHALVQIRETEAEWKEERRWPTTSVMANALDARLDAQEAAVDAEERRIASIYDLLGSRCARRGGERRGRAGGGGPREEARRAGEARRPRRSGTTSDRRIKRPSWRGLGRKAAETTRDSSTG